jgi:hypothetical protein
MCSPHGFREEARDNSSSKPSSIAAFGPVTVRFGNPIDPEVYVGICRCRRRLITTDVMTAIQSVWARRKLTRLRRERSRWSSLAEG